MYSRPNAGQTSIITWLKCSIFILLFVTSCRSKTESEQTTRGNSVPITDALKFKLTARDGSFKLEVFNPWQKATNITYTYILKKDINNPEMAGDTVIIPYPVNRVICLSTTHVAFLDALNKTNTIVGLSGTKYVYNSRVREQIRDNGIIDIGYGENLNYEAILALDPDVVFAYGINAKTLGYYQKIHEMGMPVVFIAEYLEESPLGKSEWIKVFGALYDNLDTAAHIFRNIKSSYNKLTASTDTIGDKPVVMTGLPFQGTWYVTGGATNLANMINDAGGKYLWKNLTGADVYPMQLESVYVKSSDADIWIHPGTASNTGDIVAVDERMASFDVFKRKRIYNNNARLNENGGNDYFESGVVNPHVVLKDLIHIFHPSVFSGHDLYFYKKLE